MSHYFIGSGGQNRTATHGFGDRCTATILHRNCFGGACWIRTNDQSFSPDAFLAGKCLRPTRPTLHTSSFSTILKHTTLFVVAAAEQHRNVLQYGTPYEIRTRVPAVKGRYPNH